MAIDIFLRAGEPSPRDVRLRDPTAPDVGSVTGTIAWTESGDAWALTGTALVSGVLAWTQEADVWALTGAAKVSGAIAWTESADTWAATGSALASGVLAWTQDADMWLLNGAVASPTPASVGGGGRGYYGRPAWTRKRVDETVKEWVDVEVRAMYADLVAQSPKTIQREAGKIVKPFTSEPKQKVPEPEKIDWEALARDGERVRALLLLWTEEIAEMEEEEELLLLMD